MNQVYKSVLHTISGFREKIFFALLTSFLLTSAFPKIGVDWLAWFALVPLLYSLKDLSPKQAFGIGMVSGTAHFFTLLYWLVPFLVKFGHLSFFLSIIVALGFALFLSIYFALFSLILAKFCTKPLTSLFLVPSGWVSMEYIRSYLFTGFPWELLGYSQFSRLHLIQISDIVGVFGVSFLIALSNATLFTILLYLTGISWHGSKVSKKIALWSSVSTILIFGLVFYYGNFQLGSISNQISSAKHIKVAVVQGNISQSVKWDPAYQGITIEKYIDLSVSTKRERPDLVVWPETALPFYFFNIRDAELTDMVKKGIKETEAHFLIGSPAFEFREKEVDYYNRAYLVNTKGEKIDQYDKVHLVPFGEYVPFKKWLPFINKIVEPVGNYIGGEKGKVAWWDGTGIGTLICFEVIFADLARALAKNGAAFFVNITNDAWYGTSGGPYQHFSMTVFRAVENRKALVRSANTGISGFVNPSGRVITKTPLEKEAVMTGNIPLMQIKTVYMGIGDLFAMICLAITILTCIHTIKWKNKHVT